MMKKIEVIIRKSKFDEVKEALHAAGIDFFTYWDVTGVGRERGEATFRAQVYETNFIQRRMLSFVVRDQNLDKAINAVVESARTGDMGDGKIFVSDIEDSIRIRNGERGNESLYIKAEEEPTK